MTEANSVYSWHNWSCMFSSEQPFLKTSKGILSDYQWLSLLLMTMTTKLQIIFLSRDPRPNSWVSVYELSGCGFESCCSHLRPISVSARLAITVVKKSGKNSDERIMPDQVQSSSSLSIVLWTEA